MWLKHTNMRRHYGIALSVHVFASRARGGEQHESIIPVSDEDLTAPMRSSLQRRRGSGRTQSLAFLAAHLAMIVCSGYLVPRAH